MHQNRILASLIGITTTAAIALALVLEAAPASATTRLRSGTLHAQLASHVSPAGAGSGPLALSGANVMATVVGTLALLALAFVVVTLIRRRITPA